MIAFHTGVFLVLVYQVFPGRTAKKESPFTGPLALLILFGLFNDSIDCL
jgi:hypothetical protein